MNYDMVEGDTGTKLRITCTDKDGTAIDLTGATVKLQWRDSANVEVERSMTIEDAPDGIVYYVFAADEIFTPKMVVEVEITDASSKIVSSSSTLCLSVRSQLG